MVGVLGCLQGRRFGPVSGWTALTIAVRGNHLAVGVDGRQTSDFPPEIRKGR